MTITEPRAGHTGGIVTRPSTTTSKPAVPAFACAGLGAEAVLYAFIGATWVSAHTTAELGDLTLSYQMSDLDRFHNSTHDEVGIYINGGGWAFLAASVLFVGLALYSGSRSMRAASLAAAMVGALVSLDVGVLRRLMTR